MNAYATRGAGSSRRHCALIVGLVAAAVAWMPMPVTLAADVVKANVTGTLSSGTSWVGGVAPTATDVAVWNNTVAAANATVYGANLSWQGIKIVDPGGLVTLGNSTDTTTLTIGSAGINMSSASQNLLINGNISVSGSQDWKVASGRTFQLFTLNSGRTMVGSGTMYLTNSSGAGTATFDLQPGNNGSTAFTAQGGVSGYTGSWWIGPNTIVKTLRNGINAWGSGTIFLAGGTVGQQLQFSGAWTNTMDLAANTTSTIDDFNSSGTRSLQLNGVIQGSGNLTIQDTNANVTTNKDTTFVLAAANTMSGTVTVAANSFLRVGGVGGNNNTGSGGVPTPGTAGTLGNASVVINSGGGLAFSRTNAITVSNTISGAGTVYAGSADANMTATSGQDLTLSASNSYSGGTELLNGTLRVAALSGIGSGYLAVKNSGTFVYTGSGSESTTRILWMNSGTATMSVSDANGYLTMNPSGGTRDQSFNKIGAGTLELGAVFSSTASITVNGGRLLLTATNTYTGVSTITSGTLELGGAGRLGSGAYAGVISNAGSLVVSTSADQTLSGTISGAGSLTKSGAGTLTLSGSNTFTGDTTLASGTLTLSNSSALISSTLDVGAGTVSFGTLVSATFGGLKGSGNLALANASSAAVTLTVGSNNAATTYSGTLSGAGGFEKIGTGELTLAGTSSYTGVTTLTGGTLTFTGNNSLGSNLAGSTATRLKFGANTITIGNLTAGNSIAGVFTGVLDGTGSVLLRGGSLSIMNSDGTDGTAGNDFKLQPATADMPPTAFALDTGASTTDRKDFSFRNSTNDVLTLSSLSGFGAIRGDAGGSNQMRFITANQAGDTTFNGAIVSHMSSGSVSRAIQFEKQGAGSLTLAGFIGKQTVSAGAGAVPVNLVANGGLLNVTNAFNTTTTNTAAINSSGTATITSGTLGFAAQALVNTAGTQGLASIRMNGGVLRWNTGNTQDITAGGRLTLVAGKTATFDTNGNDVTLATALGGGAISGAVTKIGGGTLTISASNAYTGATTITGGTVAVSADENLGTAPGSATAGQLVIGSGAALSATAPFTLAANRGIVLGPASGSGDGTIRVASGTLAYGGVATNNGAGTGGLVKDGAGVLRLSGLNTFTGPLTISAGEVQVGGAGQLGSGAYAAAIANAGTLRFASSANQTLSGGVTGVGSLTKSGAGKLTFTGSNSYSGPTTVDGGMFVVNGVVTSSTITVSGGAVLGGSGTTGDVVLTGGVVSPGNSPGTLTVANMSWDSTSSYTWQMYDYQSVAGTGWDQIIGSGSLAVTGTGFTFNLVSLSGTDTVGSLPANRWSQTTSGTFRLATFAGGVTTPGGNWYTINTGSFTPFSSVTGSFSVVTGGTTMDLVFTYSPPPDSTWLVGDGVWSGTGNWSPSVVPSGTTALIFSGSGGTSTNDLVAGTGEGQLAIVTGLTFSGSASGSYTITGSGFTLGSQGIVNNSTFQQTVQNDVTLASSSLVNSATAAVTLSGTITNAGYAFAVGGASNTTLSGVLTGAGGLSKVDGGTLTLAGPNDYTGGTTITGGTVVVGDGATSGLLPGNVTNNAALAFDRSDAVTFSGTINGTGSVTKLNANTLTLTGSNGYSGGTTITGGTLVVGNASALGTGNLTLAAPAVVRTAVGGTIANNVVVAAAVSGTFDTAGNSPTLAGVVSGSGSIVKVGAGTLFLAGTSTYTGDTTISAGAFQIGGAGLLGNGSYAGAISNAGTLAVATSANQTLAGVVSGVGSLSKSGAGTLTLTNAGNSYGGGSTITGGTVSFVSGGLGSVGTVTVADGALRWATGNTQDLSSRLSLVNSTTATFDTNGNDVTLATGFGGSASAGVTKVGAGTLTLAGGNTYTGVTTVSAGTLQLGAGGAAGSVAGNITNATAVVFNRSDSSTYSGIIGGVGSLTQAGTGTVALTGANTYTGNTTINAGVLQIGAGGVTGTISASSAVTIGASGTLGLNRSDVITFASPISGAGTLLKLGGVEAALTGSNAFTGLIDIQAGKIAANGANSVAGAPRVNVASGAIFSVGDPFAGGTATIGGLTGSGTVDPMYGSTTGTRTLAINQATSGTFAGIIRDAISGASRTIALVKSGAGDLTLTGANTYTGTTTLTAGRIRVGNDSALGTGTVALNGGTVSSDGATARTLANALAFGGNATLGDATDNGLLTFTGNVGLGGATRQLTTASDVTISGTVSNGNLTKAGAGTLTLSATNTYGKTTINSGTISIATASGLGTAPGSFVADQLTLDGGALRITTAGQTLVTNRGITLGAGGGTIDTSTIAGTNISTTISGTIAGTGPLTLRSTGNQTASGGSDSGLGIKLSATNTFTGNVTIPTGLVSYAADASFGAASNQIILTGGGLLDNNANIALARPIVISAGTSTFRTYGATSGTWSSPISGAAAVNRTDGGTLTLSGTLSSFTGIYDNQGGNTVLSGALPGLGAGAVMRITASTVTFASGRLGSGTAQMNGGTLQWATGNTQDVSSQILLVNGSTATFDTNGNDVPFATSFGGGSTGNVQKSGNGTLTLSTTNAYSGVTTLTGGTLAVAKLAAGGQASPIGTSSSDASNLVFNGGALSYTGSGDTTDRAIQVSAAPTINANGSGAISWTGTGVGFTTANTGYTITLGGTSTANNTWGTPLANNGSGAIALTKTGAGRWILSGSNSYTGATTISDGTLVLSGNNSLGSNLTNASGSTSAVLSFGANTVFIGNSGANSTAFYYGSLNGSGTMQLRGGSTTIVNSDGSFGANGNYQIFQYASTLSPTAFALNTGVSATDRKDFAWLNDNSTVLTLSSLSGYGALRSDAGGTGTVTRLITVNQSIDTTFDGALVSHRSGGILRQLALEKQGSGSLTLAGFIGKQTGGQAGASAVNLTANGGLLNVTNAANTTTTNTEAIRLGTVTVTSGTLAFSAQALINNAGSAGATSILMNGGVLRWNTGNTQDMTAGGQLTLVAAKTATFDTNGNDVTLGTALGGGAISASVVKIGTGALTVAAANSYTGGTLLSAGSLLVGNDSALGSGTVTLNAGTFSSNSTTARSLANSVVLGGDLTLGDATNNGLLSFSGPVDLGGAVRTLTMPSNATLSGAVTNGGLSKAGAGTLTLSNAANTFSGGVAISAGLVAVGNDAALGSGTVSLTGGGLSSDGATGRTIANALAIAGDVTLGNATNTGALTFNGGVDLGGATRQITTPSNVTIAGAVTTGGLTKTGAGTLTLSNGGNSYAGGTTLNQGTLAFASGGLGSSGNVTLANATTLRWASGNTQDISSRLILPGSGTATLDVTDGNVALASGLGAGSSVALTKAGAGTLTLSGSSGYTGTTTISGGTLALSGAGSIAASPQVSIAPGAALDISAASGLVNIGALAGSGSVALGSKTLRSLVPTAGDTTFSGTIAGSGGFTKAGAGTLTLTQLQDFEGAARVEAGTLSLYSLDPGGNKLLQNASAILVAAGATLDASTSGLAVVAGQTLGGYGTVDVGSNALVFEANSILSPGGSVGPLTTTGTVAFTGPMSYVFDVNDASGTAGGPNGWDLYTATSFTFTGFDTTTNRFVVDLTSLSGTTPNQDAANFNPSFNYAWKFLVASNGNPITATTGLNGWFQVDSTNFTNSPHPGNFYVARGDQLGAIGGSGDTNALYVVYAAVPEPGSLALAGIGLAAAAWAASRRRRRTRRAA